MRGVLTLYRRTRAFVWRYGTLTIHDHITPYLEAAYTSTRYASSVYAPLSMVG